MAIEKVEVPGRGTELGKRLLICAGLVLILSLVFRKSLLFLLAFAGESDLYSHIPMIPLVSFGLIWLNRKNLSRRVEAAPGLAAFALAMGLAALAGDWAWRGSENSLNKNDQLLLETFTFLCFFMAACLATLGREFVLENRFSFAFLAFMMPLPTFLTHGLTLFLQYASAEAANVLLRLSGTPMLREGLRFCLPGIMIEVAEQCSGIHSTLVLLITSLIAGHYFLRSPKMRLILALAVIPIGIVRNGLRIFMIAMLSVYVGPEMVSSPLHTRGGHPFFVLSFVFLLLLLALLRKLERRESSKRPAPHGD